MSHEGPKDDEVLRLELENLTSIANGLHYLLLNYKEKYPGLLDSILEKYKDLLLEEYDREYTTEELIQKNKDFIDDLMQVARNVHIPEDELTQEKLLGYHQIFIADFYSEDKKNAIDRLKQKFPGNNFGSSGKDEIH